MIQTSRRSFITGLVSFVAAPAIVKATSLMPVKAIVDEAAIARAMRDYIERLVNPAFTAAMMDFSLYGTGGLKFEAGTVHHVPFEQLHIDRGHVLKVMGAFPGLTAEYPKAG